MPFPFTLPTTSSFSFSIFFESGSHPSLPLTASTNRGVLRNTLKEHKRLSPQSQAANLSSVQLDAEAYLPYLFALDGGLSNQSIAGEEVDVILKSTPTLEWRSTLSTSPVPGCEPPRQKLNSLEYELYFVLSTLAYTHTLTSRASLQPLYSSIASSPSAEQRTAAIQTATKQLLSAAALHSYLVSRSEAISTTPPCIDISTSVFQALSSLAMAEATLLAVLKDDPYPAAVAQERNKNDKEWMIKAPEIAKVRAHLFARLCLGASEYAAQAVAQLNASGGKGQGKIDEELLKYVGDLRRVGRAKACRFFGIDAELGGKTGEAIAWLRAGLSELGFEPKAEDAKKGLSFGRIKKEWSEKREDRKVEKGTSWGSDAGRLEEARVLEMLVGKWTKINDTINTQPIPPFHPLLAKMPSGREIHTLKPYVPPSLDASTLQSMRAPPSPNASLLLDTAKDSSDEESEENTKRVPTVVGAFPGTRNEYAGAGGSRSATGGYY